MNRKLYRPLLILMLSAVMVTGMVVLANAVLIDIYTNEASWDAAVGTFSVEDFNDTTLNSGLSFATSAGSISGGVWNDYLVPTTNTTEWSFTAPVRGFGGTWDLSPAGPGTGIALYLEGVLKLVDEIPNTLVGDFWGFIATFEFDRVLLTAGSQSGSAETYTLDNMKYGPTAAVPEPSTLLLLGSGLLGIVAIGRKRAK